MASSKRDTDNDVNMSRKELAEWMKRHGVSTAELADILGMTTQGVSHWLVGRRDIPEPIGRLLNYWDNYPDRMQEF